MALKKHHELVSVQVPAGVVTVLDQFRMENGLRRTEVLRLALYEYLQVGKHIAPKQPAKEFAITV